MRFLVELFDKEPIENVLGACIFEPEIVILLCDERDAVLFKESAIYRLLRRRNLRTRPRFYYFDGTDTTAIRQVIGAVVRDYPDCVFDFTGGRDLVLLTAGEMCAEDGLPGFYVDLPRGRFINVRGCEQLAASFKMPCFSAEDVLALTGATVHGYGHFHPGHITRDFEKDILAVFAVAQHNPKAWGAFVNWLQACAAHSPPGALTVACPQKMQDGDNRVVLNPAVVDGLLAAGVLKQVQRHGKRVQLTFKSALHRKCLLNQGVWLELYCYVVAKNAGFFDDVRTSVVVDWDGVEGGPDATKNEVDVLLVKGVVPVFISCKMSPPSPLALSEIKVLSAKFGGGYSRTVVLTASVLSAEHRSLKARAADLGILLLDGGAMDSNILAGRLRDAVAGQPVGQPFPRVRPRPLKEEF